MKCSCTVCGKQIEYEAAAAGQQIGCPHCGQSTRLVAYSAAPPPIVQQTTTVSGPGRAIPLIIIIVGIAIAVPVVIAVIGLLAAIAIPNFVKARQSAQMHACIANLKTIDGAKMTWKIEYNKPDSAEPTEADLFGTQKYIPLKPVCPAGGIYFIGPLNSKPTCSIRQHRL